ncbi:MAG: ABC transporter ATP-binding protein [Cyanobacteriota bacterium]
MTQVIQVENLGKKYLITHKTGEVYLTMRDAISKNLKNLFNKTSNKGVDSKEEFWAVRGITFNVNEGDRVGIIGRNGAGKSTILKLISKITAPSEGTIKIKGRVASLLEVGTGFHLELTGKENIYLNGAVLGMGKAEIKRKFDDIVAFAEIENFLDTPVKRYSSGMYIRLAFAIASHLEPEILVVDEVLAVGDLQFQKKCIARMDEVSKEGRTILFVSHNMAIINALCNKGILLEEGKTKFIGPVNNAVEEYISNVSVFAKNTHLIDRIRPKECSLKAKIIEVSIITERGEDQDIIDSTKPFIVRFTIDASADINSAILFNINDMSQDLIRFDSALSSNKYFSFKKGINTVDCKIKPTYLTQGNYKIDFCLLRVPNEIVHDQIHDALTFSVLDLDPYNTGFNLSQKYSRFHVDHEWLENKVRK